MNSLQKTKELQRNLASRGLPFDTDFFSVQRLRRAEMVLHRWCERECNGEIQRDEDTDKPFGYYGANRDSKYPAHDLEKGALKRIKDICEAKGIYFFYQQDPRGCALYVSKEPLNDANYSNGIAVCD